MERLLYFLKWRDLSEKADLLNLHKPKISASASAETQGRARTV